jgi:hypothetical protein
VSITEDRQFGGKSMAVWICMNLCYCDIIHVHNLLRYITIKRCHILPHSFGTGRQIKWKTGKWLHNIPVKNNISKLFFKHDTALIKGQIIDINNASPLKPEAWVFSLINEFLFDTKINLDNIDISTRKRQWITKLDEWIMV